MIQTVCTSRILPPLFRVKGRNKFSRNEEYRAQLSRKDKKLLDKGLLASISKSTLYIELERIKKENEELINKLSYIEKNFESLKEMYMYTDDSKSDKKDDVDIEIRKFQEDNEK